MKTVLVLGGLGFKKEDLDTIGAEIGLQFKYALAQDIRCVINEGRVVWKIMGTQFKTIDAIWVRGLFSSAPHRNDTQQVELIAQLLHHIHQKFPRIKLFDLDAFGALDKREQLIALAKANIPVPQTHIALTVNQGFYFPFPAIVKPIFSCDGKGIELLENKDAYRAWAKSDRAYFPALIQEWIPNDGDCRVLLAGGEIIATVKRSREEGFLNNPTRAVTQEHVNLEDVALELARRATSAVGLDIAGVDLIQHQQTGEWYVLEVNQGPDLTRIAQVAQAPLEQVVKFIAKTLQSR